MVNHPQENYQILITNIQESSPASNKRIYRRDPVRRRDNHLIFNIQVERLWLFSDWVLIIFWTLAAPTVALSEGG